MTPITRPRDPSSIETRPSLALWRRASPVEELARLRAVIGARPRLLIKRDDLLPFGFGGNKVRKLALVAADASARGADALVTCGGVQSNHCRATAAIAAHLGWRCVLVHNGEPPEVATGNTRLNAIYGASSRYVAAREDRVAGMEAAADALRREGRSPYVIPLGASTPLGAAAFVKAIGELVTQGVRPDVIVHASSSGGTQAGLVAGCAWHGLDTEVIGVSADESEAGLGTVVAQILVGLGATFAPREAAIDRARIVVDASFVGDGYGIPTAASQEAQWLFARTQDVLLDHTYTAKAAAALLAYVRNGRFPGEATVLFWHTGGGPGVFA